MIFMKKILSSLFVASLSLLPYLALAADGCAATPGNLKDLICKAMELVNPIIALLTGLAVVYFVWNVLKFIRSAGDEKGRTAAKDGIVYGLIGLFVLFSFWGLVEILWRSVFL